MRMHVIDYVLWCADPVVMVAIAACMLRGRLQREFPFFFNFVLFQIAAFAVEFPLRNWVNYYYVYWIVAALGVLVSFAVLVELIQKVVDETKARLHWNVAVMCWCVLLAVVVAAIWPLSVGMDNVTNGIFVVERSVRFTQFGLAFLMVMFGTTVGLSKRNLVFGIAMGFGLFAMVNLLVMTLLSHQGLLKKIMLSRISSVAYVISMLIWLAYAVAAAKRNSSSQLPSAA